MLRYRRPALRLCGIAVLWLLLTTGFILYQGFHDDVHRADVGIVLGNEVLADGTPSDRLRARLDEAADLYARGLFAHVIVSGAPGATGFDEATVMKQYLLSRHVPEAAIIVDSRGFNTLETARNALVIMRARGFTSALAISQYFHISRTRLALHKVGIIDVYSSHAKFFEWRDVYSTLREVVGYYGYLLDLRR